MKTEDIAKAIEGMGRSYGRLRRENNRLKKKLKEQQYELKELEEYRKHGMILHTYNNVKIITNIDRMKEEEK